MRRLRAVVSGVSYEAAAEAETRVGLAEEQQAGLVAALAFPERVAKADGGSYLMASGTRAEVGDGSALRGSPWIAVAMADRPVGRGHARVQLGAVVDEETARLAAGALLEERDEVRWDGGDVVARRVERLGAVEVTVRALKDAGPGLVRDALLDGLRQEGFGLLRWSAEADALRQRLASCDCTSVRPGRTCPMTRCTRAWRSGWSRSSAGRGGGPIWRGSMPGRRWPGCCPGLPGRRGGSTSWPRSG